MESCFVSLSSSSAIIRSSCSPSVLRLSLGLLLSPGNQEVQLPKCHQEVLPWSPRFSCLLSELWRQHIVEQYPSLVMFSTLNHPPPYVLCTQARTHITCTHCHTVILWQCTVTFHSEQCICTLHILAIVVQCCPSVTYHHSVCGNRHCPHLLLG